MSRSLSLALLSHASGILLCGLTLAPLGGCHHRSSVPADPPAAQEANLGERSTEQTGAAVQSVGVGEAKAVKATRKVTRVEELLEGRFPGVRVLRAPGGGISVRIRGSDNEPLYVVDGVPVEVTAGRGLDWFSPADVARIEVLMDATETTMYGGRGANGVILITTKRSR
jgi:TonB-dependent SusC/RagA subfamily outer membrane receptor